MWWAMLGFHGAYLIVTHASKVLVAFAKVSPGPIVALSNEQRLKLIYHYSAAT